MIEVFVARHGECVTGASWTADPSLSVRGTQQAALLGQRFADQPTTRILSSPLLRALETAEIAADAMGFDGAIEVWTELREGLDSSHRLPGRLELANRFRATLPPEITNTGWDHGGDTRDSFVTRAAEVLASLRTRLRSGDRVLVIAHGGITNYLLQAATGTAAPSQVFFELAYGSITHLQLPSDKEPLHDEWPLYPTPDIAIRTIGDTGHLQPAGLEHWGG